MPDPEDSAITAIADELRAVARAIDLPRSPDPARVAAAVRRRLVRRRARSLRLRLAAAATSIGVAVLLAGSAEVRSAVVELFRFAGIVVEQGPPTAPATPTGPGFVDLDTARAAVDFPVLVPAALGAPERVTVLDDRVVSLVYKDSRLDQFDGRLEPAFTKTVPDPDAVRWLDLDGADAVWFPGPHDLTYLDRDGTRRVESARLAANTLVWQRGGVTFRLEGPFTAEQAAAVARSLR